MGIGRTSAAKVPSLREPWSPATPQDPGPAQHDRGGFCRLPIPPTSRDRLYRTLSASHGTENARASRRGAFPWSPCLHYAAKGQEFTANWRRCTANASRVVPGDRRISACLVEVAGLRWASAQLSSQPPGTLAAIGQGQPAWQGKFFRSPDSREALVLSPPLAMQLLVTLSRCWQCRCSTASWR